MSLNSLKEEEETMAVILWCPSGYGAVFLRSYLELPKGEKKKKIICFKSIFLLLCPNIMQ